MYQVKVEHVERSFQLSIPPMDLKAVRAHCPSRLTRKNKQFDHDS